MKHYSLHVQAEGPRAPASSVCVAAGEAPNEDAFWAEHAVAAETHPWRLEHDALRVEVRERGRGTVMGATFYPEEPIASARSASDPAFSGILDDREPDFCSILRDVDADELARRVEQWRARNRPAPAMAEEETGAEEPARHVFDQFEREIERFVPRREVTITIDRTHPLWSAWPGMRVSLDRGGMRVSLDRGEWYVASVMHDGNRRVLYLREVS